MFSKIRENEKTGISLKTAIGRAIASMPESYVIKAFIDKHRAEVEGMLDTAEAAEERIKQLFLVLSGSSAASAGISGDGNKS